MVVAWWVRSLLLQLPSTSDPFAFLIYSCSFTHYPTPSFERPPSDHFFSLYHLYIFSHGHTLSQSSSRLASKCTLDLAPPLSLHGASSRAELGLSNNGVAAGHGGAAGPGNGGGLLLRPAFPGLLPELEVQDSGVQPPVQKQVGPAAPDGLRRPLRPHHLARPDHRYVLAPFLSNYSPDDRHASNSLL